MIRKRSTATVPAHRSLIKVAVIAAALIASLVAVPAANAGGGLQVQSLSDTLTPADLASTLVGSGVTSISNVQYAGADGAAGTFSGGGTGDGAIVGFDQGIILSTGSVSNVVGPNQFDNVTASNGQPGDTDLDGLLVGQSTQDAAVLSFDFVANASSISFRYVFASDEYNEYVNSNYNDVFGFFVNGSTVAADCATIDGQPVSVNTINGGNPIGTDASHPELFRNNSTDPGPPAIDTEMDGLTTVLLCQAPVVANEPNTMKLAIGDVTDSQYDSNVFIESGSLTTTPPVGTPTDVSAFPSNGSAIVTWTPPDTGPAIDEFEVTCTATGNPDDSNTVSVAGTESSAEVGGLTNGTEYTCSVRAHSGSTAGQWSDPSDPFTPSDAAVSQSIDPNAGATVTLTPAQSNLGTSGQFVMSPTSGSSDPVIFTASLFGTPGEVDTTCGGHTCVGQGIEWAFSDPGAIGGVTVTFLEDRSLVGSASATTASVYKDGILVRNCKGGRPPIPSTCVVKRTTFRKGRVAWAIVIRTTGDDPKGRV